MITAKNVDSAFESFNLQKFEGKGLDLADVFEQASIMPMMSDKRCLVVEDYKLEGANEKDISHITAYVESCPDTSIVIFLQKNPEFSLAKAKKAADIISKHGAVCTLNKRTGNDLIKPLICAANKQGCVLSTQMANYLVSQVGDDFNVLINELHKVCGYAAGGEITKAHIDAVAVKTDDVKIYYLTKALMSKDFDKAYKVLHTLLKQKVEAQYILGTIISAYVDMYRAKVSLFCGERADALAADFAYRNTAFRLTNAARDASKLDLPTIRKCLEVLSEADMRLKKSYDSDIIILEQLMVRLFLVSNGERI
jgi:DNA polymerase-3 subunit delta